MHIPPGAHRLKSVSESLRIIPLGGLGEVGKNMTVYETGGELLIVDAGLAFPRDEHLGVDLLLPDVGYLEGRTVRAVVLTHGHEDHVGGLPYLLREVDVRTVVATRLTLALVKTKLDEHGLGQKAELLEWGPEQEPLELGPFSVEMVRVAHSIPDSVTLVIETGAGRVVHTGDWKLDHTPVDGLRTDVGKLAEIGNRGVDLMLGDSTNAERPGSTGSERLVGEAFRTLFPLRTGRILVASFASNIHRMQQAADVAIECGRKITVVGRSLRKNMNIARNLGYVDIPEDAIVKPDEASELPPHRVLALCTGSQGEPMSALTRVAYGDHPTLSVAPGDTVIISAKPVPGNELRVHDSINQLARAGAEVLHEEIAPVHVSGHACQEELRTMISLLRPRYVMPIHGEYRMLAAHAKLAREADIPEDRIILADNGSVVELARGEARLVGVVDAGVTFVDGLRVGSLQDVALRDRRRLADDGVLIVVTTLAASDGNEIAPPELIARGFVGVGRAARRAPGRGRQGGPTACSRARDRDQASPGAHPRRGRADRLRPDAAAADGAAGGDRSLMSWASIIEQNAATEPTAAKLISQLRACEVSALAFCRLLERWGRGEAIPPTPGGRQAALRRAADRVETALAGLERPLSRYLLELEPELAEGRSWYGGPGAGELVEWRPVLERAGVRASPDRVAAVYLELAVLLRALEGLTAAADLDACPDRSSLWAGLFDLRDTLLGSTVDDLRALAA